MTGSQEVGGYCVPSNGNYAVYASLQVTTNGFGAQGRWIGVCLEVKSVKVIAVLERRYSPENQGLCKVYYKTMECLRRRFVGLMVQEAENGQ